MINLTLKFLLPILQKEKTVNEYNIMATTKTRDLWKCSKKYSGGGKLNPLGHVGQVKHDRP